jgi:predicted RNA-binding protein YlxR (DUF448 family)
VLDIVGRTTYIKANMKALLQRHKKKKEEKDKKKKGALSSPSSPDESEEVTRMASACLTF